MTDAGADDGLHLVIRDEAAIVRALRHDGALRRLAGRGVPGCVVPGDPAWYGRFGFAASA